MNKITINVNGEAKVLEGVDPSTPLLWVLRDHLGMVGTKFGCGKGLCGACTVHVSGYAMRSCSIPLAAVQSQPVTTIEGLAATADKPSKDGLHPLQQAWLEHDVPQCGYCQAGQLMNAAAMLAQNPNPSDEDIDTAMAGNICRCGTYPRIRKAIHSAAGNDVALFHDATQSHKEESQA